MLKKSVTRWKSKKCLHSSQLRYRASGQGHPNYVFHCEELPYDEQTRLNTFEFLGLFDEPTQ